MPYRLLPETRSGPDVGEALHALLQAYKDGDLTGLAFVAMRRAGAATSRRLWARAPQMRPGRGARWAS